MMDADEFRSRHDGPPQASGARPFAVEVQPSELAGGLRAQRPGALHARGYAFRGSPPLPWPAPGSAHYGKGTSPTARRANARNVTFLIAAVGVPR
jgi:hypothetical protein